MRNLSPTRSFRGRQAGIPALRAAAAAALVACALGSAHASTLLGLYTFEGANGNFANVVDASGNGNHPVTIAPSVSVTTGGGGYQGEAARFRPTSEMMPNSGFEVAIDISPTQGNLTVGGWLKWQPTTNTTDVHIGGSSSTSGYGLNSFFGHDDGCWDRGLWYGSNGWEITGALGCGGPQPTGATMSAEAWHFVAVSYLGNQASLYIDGVFKSSMESHDDGSGSPLLRFGAFDGDWTTEPWDGLMDNLFVMREALTADQIGTIHRHGLAGILDVAGQQSLAQAPTTSDVPEPGSLALVGLAATALLLSRRRRA